MIALANWSSKKRTIEVLVESDESIKYWSEFSLESETKQTILSECDSLPWEGRGPYLVHAREENSSAWVTADPVTEAKQLADYTESDRIKIEITYEDSTVSAALWPDQMDCS